MPPSEVLMPPVMGLQVSQEKSVHRQKQSISGASLRQKTPGKIPVDTEDLDESW